MSGRTITQRISLVGGDEIKVQLEGIGKAGELAFTRLQAAANTSSPFAKLGGAIESIKIKMQTIGEAGRKVGESMAKVGESVGSVATRLGLVAGIGLVGAGKKLVEVARSAGESQAALDQNAAALGVNAAQLDTFQKVAGLSGIKGEELQKALQKMTGAANDQIKSDRTMATTKRDLFRQFQTGEITYDTYWRALKKINDAAADQNDVFTRLGISYKNADGTAKDSLTLFKDIGTALRGVENGTTRSGLAMEIFGTRNVKVTKFATMSRVEFEKQRREVERLTPALKDAEREGLANFGDRLGLLGRTATTTRDKIFALFAPQMTRVVDALTERVAAMRESMVRVANDLLEKFKPVVDDIVAVIEGRDADVKNSSVLKFRDAAVQAFDDIKSAITGLLAAFEMLKKGLDVFADGINAVFGTKLTGGEILAAAALLRLSGLLVFVTRSAGLLWSVVRLLAVAFGGWTVALAAAGFVLGYFIVQSIQKMGGLQAIATRVLQGIPIIIGRVLAGIPILIGKAVGFVAGLVSSIGSGIGSLVSSIAGFFAPAVAAVMAFASSIVTAIGNVPTQIGALFIALGAKIAAVWSAIVSTAADLWKGVTQLFSDGINAVAQFFASLPQRIAEAFAAVVQFFKDTWDNIVKDAGIAGQGLMDVFKSAVDTIGDYFKGLYDSVVGYFDGLLEKAKAVGSAIANAFNGGGGGDQPSGFAGGGHVRGPGSGTSDSILARLSNGEFVMRAAAVRKWGVGFLSMLNGLRNPLAGFAAGGMVNAASAMLPNVPRFAAGGLVMADAGGGAGGRPFTLQLGGDSFGGMTASQDTVDRLQKYAVRKNVRSAGRKPTWFQG